MIIFFGEESDNKIESPKFMMSKNIFCTTLSIRRNCMVNQLKSIARWIKIGKIRLLSFDERICIEYHK